MLTTVLYANPLMRLMPRQLLPSRSCLQHLLNLFWCDMAVVVERIKALTEGLFALGAEIALMSVGHSNHVCEF